MKKILLISLFLVLLTPARASHIVGGEMALVHVPNTLYRYRVEMILYYDSKFGDTGGDREALVRIFKKSTNESLMDLTLFAEGPFTEPPPFGYAIGSSVKYFQPECSDGSIKTNRVFYQSNEFELSPEVFNDLNGYYMVYERCCRNYRLTNIYSQDPNIASSEYDKIAGQIFYLEFPPVIKDNEPFINSSPKLFPPLSDYGCPNRRYFVNFAGTDDDGDSLAYSLVTPLNSKERRLALPSGGANPGPYDSITWKPGFGNTNFMNGNPDLKISDDGLLTITPTNISVGLYVFAVRCQEFRDGVKIGEVRRDFQMLVQDACPVAEPPEIVGKASGFDFGTTNQLSVSFENTVSDADRCFEVRISDPDALKFDDNFSEDVKIRAFPIGFKKDIKKIIPELDSATISNDGTAIFRICLPKCSYTGGIYQIGIVAFDDACTLPLSDTLYVTVDIEPPPNNKPQFNNPDGLTEINDSVSEDEEPIPTWSLQATDADGDVLTYRLVPVGFKLEDVGMSFTGLLKGTGSVPLDKQLSWDPKCDVYDFTKKTDYKLYFIVDDNDECMFNHADTTTLNLSIIDFTEIEPPIIDYLLTPLLQDNAVVANSDTLELHWKIHDPSPILIDVSGTDIDNTNILLRGNGIGFNALSYGATFPRDFDQGSVATQFGWEFDCSKFDLNEKSEFEFQLMVVDSLNKCRFYKADTLHVIVHVEPPDNVDPELLIESENSDQPIVDGSVTAILGSPIEFTLTGTDGDTSPTDFLKLELIEQTGNVNPKGFSFTAKDGNSPLQTSFTWSPDCEIFENGIYENNYVFKFALKDDRCFNEMADTVTLNLTIKDVDGSDEEFLPPNAFSPNGDQWNEFYAMVKEVGSGDFESILPKDNCVGKFIGITFYNRWGKQVYESNNPDFKWYGEDLPTGIYYYYLLYSNKKYKGLVSIQY